MGPLPTWRLGHVVVPVRHATWSDSVDSLSFDVRGEFIDYMMCRPSLDGSVSVGNERPTDHLGRRVPLPIHDEDDLHLYTGIHVRPKTFALTVAELESGALRARIDGTADVEWDERLGKDVAFVIEGWFRPSGPPAWARR